jgi:GT2 family glycosyltransferase
MVSVIILAYNRVAEVLITLQKMESVKARAPFPVEIIVVDNASTDHTSEQVRKAFPGVHLITRTKNSGVSGWNDGFEVARYKYFVVLDDDSHIENGLEDAVAYMEENKKVGILGFNIVDQNFKGDPKLDPNEAWKHLEEIPGFIGCGALIRADVYNRIGGFAEWLFIYTHEFDYAIRCLNAGYKVIFFETATVVHRASVINRTNKRLRIFGARNEMGIVYKYFPQKRWKYIWRIFLNNLKFARREGFKSAIYIIKGLLQFLQLRKKLVHTPVSKEVQQFYAAKFWSTKPVFQNLKKRFS